MAAPGKAELFRGFLKLGAMAFGGTGPMTRHVVVEERRWLDDKEFAALLGLCQALPGANTCNLAVMIGDRFQGAAGAAAALAGLMLVPLATLVAIASAFAELARYPEMRWAIAGAAAAAAGLVIGTALKMARALRVGWRAGAFIALAFAAAGLARLSLPLTLAVLLPASLAAVAWEARR